MNDLAALLGGGAAPAAPLPSGPDPSLLAGGSVDPLMAALGGGGDPMMADPMMAMGGSPQFPMTDPNVVGSMLEQLLLGQQAEHAMLAQQHQSALLGNPLFEALVSGAPLGPGAGQDAQAIGATGDIAPDPLMPA